MKIERGRYLLDFLSNRTNGLIRAFREYLLIQTKTIFKSFPCCFVERHFLTVLFMILSLAVEATQFPKINLDSLYQCLNNAIDSTSIYVKMRQERINSLYREYCRCSGQREKYRYSFALYEEYRSFKSDSAVAYLCRCISLADNFGDRKWENDCRARLAFQCSTIGMYAESLELLNAIDTLMLDTEGLRNYLIAGQHLYSEMTKYTSVPWLRQKYKAESDNFLKQIFSQLRPDDDEYLQRRLVESLKKNDINDALQVSNRWLSHVEYGSHRYAIAAYYRFCVCRARNMQEEMLYWLIESSLSDVRLAVMDQGSLWELADILSTNPDNIKQSYKYISFAWNSAQTFKTRMRNNQISPVMSLIDSNYQKYIARANAKLRFVICVVCLLLIIVVALFFYVNQQRHKLQTARNNLDASNCELKNLNHQLFEYNEKLNEINEKLASTNKSLDESNKMKELYIGRFLSLCSTYIDNTETLRRNILTRVKNKDYSGLARLAQAKTGELNDFYRNFDSAFLNLFPNFVKDFNALLRPEKRIAVTLNGSLDTSIRIFALIRLGIDDSSRIAEFLHYSVNTIYNYRAKIKNGALGDRTEFEQRVKQIGME